MTVLYRVLEYFFLFVKIETKQITRSFDRVICLKIIFIYAAIAGACLVMVRIQRAHTRWFPNFWRFTPWRLRVFTFEWLRLAAFFAPRSHMSHNRGILKFFSKRKIFFESGEQFQEIPLLDLLWR